MSNPDPMTRAAEALERIGEALARIAEALERSTAREADLPWNPSTSEPPLS